jgi:hypothetical protein
MLTSQRREIRQATNRRGTSVHARRQCAALHVAVLPVIQREPGSSHRGLLRQEEERELSAFPLPPFAPNGPAAPAGPNGSPGPAGSIGLIDCEVFVEQLTRQKSGPWVARALFPPKPREPPQAVGPWVQRSCQRNRTPALHGAHFR